MANTTITVERLETKETTIKVQAASPEEAFDKVKMGQGTELGSVDRAELVIRDYPDEGTEQHTLVAKKK